MALLDYEWPNSKPVLKTKAGVELRNNGLFITNSDGDAWIQLQLDDWEKRRLLRVLLGDFVHGVLT